MRWWLVSICVTAGTIPAAAQSRAELIGKVKARVAENMARLPNYSGAETIHRARRIRRNIRFAPRIRFGLILHLSMGRNSMVFKVTAGSTRQIPNNLLDHRLEMANSPGL